MADTRVQINPNVLSWAIKRAGVDLHHRFPRPDDWLSGTAQPTLRQLEDFAKTASVPFGYLFLPEPPRGSVADPPLSNAGAAAKRASKSRFAGNDLHYATASGMDAGIPD